ncbi:hypothetical protein N7450_001080 [Penicillium hetheringtonii]|uniref:Uncharacterized protein n=1 Tax=Penicillium hetheringtonii TaxID=911720 RepID=A0AAD6E4P9_9EURO|nr:hypothetical protein N7450_001080 [Penicillium hetheringtonii]
MSISIHGRLRRRQPHVTLEASHADRPPATLHTDPARFLIDLPSLFSTGASVTRQLLVEIHTCETRGIGYSWSLVSLEHTGCENRAWSRAALLVPSGAPGALLRRLPIQPFPGGSVTLPPSLFPTTKNAAKQTLWHITPRLYLHPIHTP